MNKTSLRNVLFSALLLAFAWPVYGTENLDAPLPVDPQVRIGKLENGLTYYIRKNAKPARRVELRLVVKAGSILEDDDQQGLAHFTEHMAFDGSRHFKKHELVSYLQSIGVKFGADLNAYTSFDETVYILPIPTDKPEQPGNRIPGAGRLGTGRDHGGRGNRPGAQHRAGRGAHGQGRGRPHAAQAVAAGVQRLPLCAAHPDRERSDLAAFPLCRDPPVLCRLVPP